MSAIAEKPANQYVVNFHDMETKPTIGKTSTGEGASFNGDRIYCGLVTKKKGTGSKAHYHPDETFNYVLKGALQVDTRQDTHQIAAGQAVIVPRGEWVRYSTPSAEGAEYIAVCLPAFSPATVHRDEGTA